MANFPTLNTRAPKASKLAWLSNPKSPLYGRKLISGIRVPSNGNQVPYSTGVLQTSYGKLGGSVLQILLNSDPSSSVISEGHSVGMERELDGTQFSEEEENWQSFHYTEGRILGILSALGAWNPETDPDPQLAGFPTETTGTLAHYLFSITEPIG